ncbi:hypothetical protein ACJMK2_010528 [Sinanodonta woodiana]|uniref:Large ribosomal subunit protein mL38 n=1 Tax=Sinanodonta woodiana TaxID=1069815 RepID=A0ABD3VH84_SINWO
MAAPMLNVRNVLQFLLGKESFIQVQPARFRYKFIRRKGKPYEESPNWNQRLADLNKKDPELDKVNDIGLPPISRSTPSRKNMKAWLITDRFKLEQQARLRKLVIPVNEVQSERFSESGGQYIKDVADHYGIFRDLFSGAYFYPQVDLNVNYDYDEESVTPVYQGNILLPSEAKSIPTVSYDCEDKSSLHTLVMTAPDSHLQDNKSEYLHWMVGNIPGQSVSVGEVVCPYMQPFPLKGTGLHRYIFVLFKQSKKIDFTEEKRPSPCLSLQRRTFRMEDFYRKHENNLIPIGLSFFQAKWEKSLTEFFWHTLGIKEPAFEFIHPPQYHPAQVRYPHRQPFNLYLDRYRDVKDIQEEVLKEKLKNLSPFVPKTKTKYPNIYHIDTAVSSWRRLKIQHQRLRRMQWKDLDD